MIKRFFLQEVSSWNLWMPQRMNLINSVDFCKLTLVGLETIFIKKNHIFFLGILVKGWSEDVTLLDCELTLLEKTLFPCDKTVFSQGHYYKALVKEVAYYQKH